MFNTTIDFDLAEDHRRQLLDEAATHRLALAARPKRSRRRGGGPEDGGLKSIGRALRPLAVALVGLAVAGVSVSTLVPTLRPGGAAVVSARPANGDSVSAQVGIVDLIYEPNHSSGWHVHQGIHSVVVLSGTLTVYDQACQRHDYGPGQTYLGGREPHLARNVGPEAAALVVTYVQDKSVAEDHGKPTDAPGGCEAV